MNAPIKDGGRVMGGIDPRVVAAFNAIGQWAGPTLTVALEAALATQVQRAPVAFTVVDPTGKSSIGGWMDYRHFAVIQQMAVLREGHSYAFAYAAEPALAAREAQS